MPGAGNACPVALGSWPGWPRASARRCFSFTSPLACKTTGTGPFQFAASRRLPQLSEMFAPYENPLLLLWFAAFAAGAFLLRRNRRGSRMLSLLSVSLMAAPFAWALLYLLVEEDPAERAERLLALWPVVLIVSLLFALWEVRRGLSVARLLPFILIGTVQGAFLSQQLWGSTYAIWPLLTILLAGVLAELFRLARRKFLAARSSCWPASRRYPCSFPADFTSRATSG